MSAAGTTTLASGAGLRRAGGSPAPPGEAVPQAQAAHPAGRPPPLGFISAAAASAALASTSSTSSSCSSMSVGGGNPTATPLCFAQAPLSRPAPSSSPSSGSSGYSAASCTAAASALASYSPLATLVGQQPAPSGPGGALGLGESPARFTPPSGAGPAHLAAALGELQLQHQAAGSGGVGGGGGGSLAAAADEAQLAEEREREANRKLRLQLYVFVLRCISYPFNAKQQLATGDHRQQLLKLKRAQLEQIVQAHSRFLKQAQQQQWFSGAKCPHQHLKQHLREQQLRQLDELYERAHRSFQRRFLLNERMKQLVDFQCCSQQDLRDLFRQNAERTLKQSPLFLQAQQQVAQQQYHATSQSRLSQQEAAASSQLLAQKELILDCWLLKFESIIREPPPNAGPDYYCQLGDSALAPSGGLPSGSGGGSCSGRSASGDMQQQQQQHMTKEQLYQMFQNVLSIKKFEHQLLYNALQLDSGDEQAAAIRRELDGRVARIAELERNRKLLPKFVLKEMESLYMDEARMSVNKLMINLDSLPLTKGAGCLPAGSQLATCGPLGAATGELQASTTTDSTSSRASNVASQVVYGGLSKFRRYNSR